MYMSYVESISEMLHLMDVESSHLQYQCGQRKPIVAVGRGITNSTHELLHSLL